MCVVKVLVNVHAGQGGGQRCGGALGLENKRVELNDRRAKGYGEALRNLALCVSRFLFGLFAQSFLLYFIFFFILFQTQSVQ